MLITQVSTHSTSGVAAANLTSVKKTYQAPQASKLSSTRTDSVKLTGEALARSMKLEGYSAAVIALKMGLDIKTVDQYLGITIPTTSTSAKSTYVQPKSSNTTSKTTK